MKQLNAENPVLKQTMGLLSGWIGKKYSNTICVLCSMHDKVNRYISNGVSRCIQSIYLFGTFIIGIILFGFILNILLSFTASRSTNPIGKKFFTLLPFLNTVILIFILIIGNFTGL